MAVYSGTLFPLHSNGLGLALDDVRAQTHRVPDGTVDVVLLYAQGNAAQVVVDKQLVALDFRQLGHIQPDVDVVLFLLFFMALQPMVNIQLGMMTIF